MPSTKGPRMTIQEVMQDMSSRGLKMTPRTISECLLSGALPFGRVLNVGDSGRTTFLIFRKDYEDWAREYLDIYQ